MTAGFGSCWEKRANCSAKGGRAGWLLLLLWALKGGGGGGRRQKEGMGVPEIWTQPSAAVGAEIIAAGFTRAGRVSHG